MNSLYIILNQQAAEHSVHADPATNTRDRRLDSHRQNGFVRDIGFYPFRGRVSSLQPPVSHSATLTCTAAYAVRCKCRGRCREPLGRRESRFMPEPNPARIMTFATPKDLGRWLKVNHATESELWVKIFKKKTGIPSVTWDDVVIEALCWGWIDGVKKSIDDQAYLQRITPRKARSNWSKRNKEHAERLISEGLMTESGLVHVRAAKADGRWENAYTASEMKVPADFLAALESKPKAKKFFETLNKSSRFVIAYGLTSAKKPETRQRRFEKFMDMLVRGEEPGLGVN